jgi:hypothetical protein
MVANQERNQVPQEFQDYLTLLGGVNRYDQPMFKLAWAQTETRIAGGTWSVDECTRTGYRRLLTGSGEPCWVILQYHSAEEYGSPEGYYVANYDQESGLQTLGEYPYDGRYEVLYHLRWNELIDDKLTLHSFPLETWILDMIVPIVIAAKDVSLEKRKAAYLDARQRDEDEKTASIERHLQDKNIPFTGAVSFGRQGIRSTVIDQKALLLQREWANLQAAARKFRPGLQTR